MQDFFIAKQPILDSLLNVVGYELLFRDSMNNFYPNICPDKATKKLIDGAFLSGDFHQELGPSKAFINFTEKAIIQNDPLLLDPKVLTVELLETCQPTPELLSACEQLHKKGYTIALDDFIFSHDWSSFLPFVDIIKIDVQHIDDDSLLNLFFALKKFPNILLLAEKVDSFEQYHKYLAMGFRYFQGYFFAKPQISQKKVLSAKQTVILQLISEISSKDYDLNDLAKHFNSDVELTCRLLNYVNSSRFSRKCKISTIKQGLASLGTSEISKFIHTLFILEMGNEKPDELSRMALFRASLCEQVAVRAGHANAETAFLTGMISVLDAMFDKPIKDVLSSMPVTPAITDALLGKPGHLQNYLRLAIAYEKGQWSLVTKIAVHYGISRDVLIEMSQRAQSWANEQCPVQKDSIKSKNEVA